MYAMELNNVRRDFETRVKQNSKGVEIFSAMIKGEDIKSKYAKDVDKLYGYLKDLGSRSLQGDEMAKSELNSLIRFAIQPALQTRINLFEFMGKFSKIGYAEQAMLTRYKHNTRSGFQAAQGDMLLSTLEKSEEPMKTQTITGGFAVNYREVASGNLTQIGEAVEQVKVDIHNKAMHYVISTLYNAIKDATGVKYYAEQKGVVKDALDNILTNVRRNGRPSILGDYAVVSQIGGFDKAGAFAPAGLSDVALEEIRNVGYLAMYNGSPVIEIPNQYNRQELNADQSNYKTVLPEGLLFVVPQGNNGRHPLQIVQRGDLMSARGFDVHTGTEISRFDLEIGAGVAEPDAIGLLSDTNFEAPSL